MYMQEWTPFIGEHQRDEANEQDPYAVAIVKRTAGCRTKVVGHMPSRISAACSYSVSSAKWKYRAYNNWSKTLFF